MEQMQFDPLPEQEQPGVRRDAAAGPACGQRRPDAAALRGGQAEDEPDAPEGARLGPHRPRRGRGGQQPRLLQPAKLVRGLERSGQNGWMLFDPTVTRK